MGVFDMLTYALAALTLVTTIIASQDCGRPLPIQAPFKNDPSKGDHPTTAEDTWVFSLSSGKEGEMIVAYVVRSGNYFVNKRGGADWVKLTGSSMATAQQSLAVLLAPSNPHIIYKPDFNKASYLRSNDSGQKWQKLRFSIVDDASKSILAQTQHGYQVVFKISAIDAVNPLRLYATVRLVPDNSRGYDKPVQQPDTLYVSNDGGDSWKTLAKGFRNGAPIGVSPLKPNRLYGITADDQLTVSDDNGVSWTSIQNDAFAESLRYVVDVGRDQKIRRIPHRSLIRQLLVSPANEEEIYIVCDIGILRSVDGGRKWRLLDLGFDELKSVNSIALGSGSSSQMYVGTLHGLLVSDDGGCNFKTVLPR
jgi:photosystem II stability/assembly factor-like uncharacterized protein